MKNNFWPVTLSFILGSQSVLAADMCQSIFVTTKRSHFETAEVMDVSRTEKTLVYSSKPKSQSDLLEAIQYAKSHGLKITIKGTNHSHGGHNRKSADKMGRPQSIQIDMLDFNKILHLDKKNLEVTVEAGVTWKDLSIYLNEHGLAAKTEQSSNIFSIGGSVATNIHGRDIHGPIANSVKEIYFLDAKGTEHRVTAENNNALFKALVGGYGSLGIITKITLKIEKNYLYEAQSTQDVPVSQYISYLKDLAGKPSNLMHYGRVNISGKTAFTRMSFVEWRPVNESKVPSQWQGWKMDLVEKNRWASSMIMNLMRYRPTSTFGKYVKDFMDKFFGLPKTGTLKTKNNILNNPVQFLFDNFYNQHKSVDILQEYFIPVNKLELFLEGLKNTTNKYDLGLMNATMRYIPKVERSRDSVLSPYSTKEDLVAVVLYFNIQEKGSKQNGMQVEYDGSVWTQELIQHSQNLGGTFYWPYHRWWKKEQITHNQKENIEEFFKIKDTVDPSNLFESDFIYHLRESL